MKSTRTLALALFLLSLAPRVHAACSNASATGSFGFTTNGTLFLPGPAPVVAVGSITFDRDGRTTGSQDRSVAGDVAHETLTGTLTVNRNCSLTLVANVFDTSGNLVRTSTIQGVLVNNGKQIRAIFESVVLPDGTSLRSVLTTDADRIRGDSD